jgi:glycosyltransferase involved in cell wall biosynthesis
MIHLDVTKTGRAAHRSGLMRVTTRLAAELGGAAHTIRWPFTTITPAKSDWFLTAELFSEVERPGFGAFLDAPPCRTAAIFADAIPLKFPHITWPQSVARHPTYLKLLAKFERVWAISAASKAELEGYWHWLRLEHVPAVDILPLGADLSNVARVRQRSSLTGRPRFLCVGILEPRKNQAFLLDVCEALWSQGQDFELHIVGRVNPHFGAPIVRRIKALARAFPGKLTYHKAIGDAALFDLYATARATLFPTIAEGCGLPLLESLWLGTPCVCSDLPVLQENAAGGGCLALPLNDSGAWRDGLRRVLDDVELVSRLAAEAIARPLPTWSEAAAVLRQSLV